MERNFAIGNFTIVVVAADHNPSILNPDFLRINDIVPSDFKVIETPGMMQ